jgi:hypothetical protein
MKRGINMNEKTQRRPALAIDAQQWAMKSALAAALVVAGLIAAPGARAESNYITATGTATAHLNFQIVIPKFLFLQVGTGTSFANNAAIDTITFDMSAAVASLGNGVAQNATAGSGDLTNGAVTARVVGNNFAAATNLTATTAGAMSNGTGSTISWSEITVATAAAPTNPTGTTLAHPGTLAAPFADGASTTVSLTPVAKVINQAAKWTFTYKNTNIPASGTYGNTVANNGQVTYTIALP